MYVLSVFSEETELSWSVFGVYSTADKAHTAILNHITGTNVTIIGQEYVEMGTEIFYGFDGDEDNPITFMIEKMTLDDTDI